MNNIQLMKDLFEKMAWDAFDGYTDYINEGTKAYDDLKAETEFKIKQFNTVADRLTAHLTGARALFSVVCTKYYDTEYSRIYDRALMWEESWRKLEQEVAEFRAQFDVLLEVTAPEPDNYEI